MSRADNFILNLLGVNLGETIMKYYNGAYSDVTIGNMTKIMTHKTALNIVQEEISADFKHIKFSYRDSNNSRFTIHTSNSNTSEDNPNYKRLCNWHRGELAPDNRGIGIPVDYVEYRSEATGYVIHQYIGDKLHCGWSCMIKAMRDSKKYNSYNEYLARMMWNDCHPGEPFPEGAAEYELLDINGGSMNHDDWTKIDINLIMPVTVTSCASIKHYAMICG